MELGSPVASQLSESAGFHHFSLRSGPLLGLCLTHSSLYPRDLVSADCWEGMGRGITNPIFQPMSQTLLSHGMSWHLRSAQSEGGNGITILRYLVLPGVCWGSLRGYTMKSVMSTMLRGHFSTESRGRRSSELSLLLLGRLVLH